MLFIATHTYTAPEIRPGRPGKNPTYLSFVVQQATAAVRTACAALVPVTLYGGMGCAEGLSLTAVIG